MLTRRRFCLLAGGVGGLTATLGWPALGQPPENQLRVIAYNIYKCTGWPGNRPLAQQAVKLGQMPKRLDNVWAAGPIAKQVVESRPPYQGAFRLNIADQQSFALSDHLPQLAVFDME